jgi:hypothetical protein
VCENRVLLRGPQAKDDYALDTEYTGGAVTGLCVTDVTRCDVDHAPGNKNAAQEGSAEGLQ